MFLLTKIILIINLINGNIKNWFSNGVSNAVTLLYPMLWVKGRKVVKMVIRRGRKMVKVSFWHISFKVFVIEFSSRSMGVKLVKTFKNQFYKPNLNENNVINHFWYFSSYYSLRWMIQHTNSWINDKTILQFSLQSVDRFGRKSVPAQKIADKMKI